MTRKELYIRISYVLLMSIGLIFISRAQNPPQKVSANYQFQSSGADSSNRLPKYKSKNAVFMDKGAVYYDTVDKKIHWITDTSGGFPWHDTTFSGSSSNLSLVARNGWNNVVDSTIDYRFLIDASCIPEPTSTFSLNQPIIWGFLNNTTSHGRSFYDSLYGDNSTAGLIITYPTIRTVLSNVIVTDESFANNDCFVGSTTGVSNFEAYCSRTSINGLRFFGNGTTWNTTGSPSIILSAWNPGGLLPPGATGINITSDPGGSVSNINSAGLLIVYTGSNNYHVREVVSALGSYDLAFVLVNNNTGADVTTAPTSTDVVKIQNAGLAPTGVSLSTYSVSNEFFGSNTNFFVRGIYEGWIISNPVDTNDIQVSFQTRYPSATIYHIYRANNKQFVGQTLVYSGNGGEFVDTGLLKGRMYYYHYMPVVGGIEQDISWTKCPTLSQP